MKRRTKSLFKHQRRSSFGASVPTWLSSPGRVYLRRHATPAKYDPVVEEVDLVHETPSYARVRFPAGRETTVSLRDTSGSGNLVNPEANADACDLPDASYACNRVCDNGENPDDSGFTNAGETPLADVPSPEMPVMSPVAWEDQHVKESPLIDTVLCRIFSNLQLFLFSFVRSTHVICTGENAVVNFLKRNSCASVDCLLQARRQDLAAGGGAKTRRGPHF